MGLIKAFTSGTFSYIGDMWEDYIYCDALDNDVLVRKGRKKRSPGAGKNADDNVITEGSKIAVNAGQILIVVENGRIIDFTAEQGGYEYISSTEPSMFVGDFGESLRISKEEIKKRFNYCRTPSNDQRVYFVNAKEILNNRFGFGNVPYHDKEFDLTILLQGFGTYSYKISNPLIFFEKVYGNVANEYKKDTLVPQLRAEIQNAILPVLGELSNRGVHYDQMSLHTESIFELLKESLGQKWQDERGIEILTMTFGNIMPDDESMDKIRDLQESRADSNNTATAPTPDENTWVCSCGMVNTMKFCPNCGSKKPEPKTCAACGFVFPKELAGMKFCPNCGNKCEE